MKTLMLGDILNKKEISILIKKMTADDDGWIDTMSNITTILVMYNDATPSASKILWARYPMISHTSIMDISDAITDVIGKEEYEFIMNNIHVFERKYDRMK